MPECRVPALLLIETGFIVLLATACHEPVARFGTAEGGNDATGNGPGAGPGEAGGTATEGGGPGGEVTDSVGETGPGGPGEGSSECDNGGLEAVVDGQDREPPARTSCTDSTYTDLLSPGYTPDPAITSMVQGLVGSMDITEKANQMRGTDPGGGQNFSDIFRQPDDANRGIRGFRFRDGPRGVNLVAELPAGHNGYATAFPTSIARGAAFDVCLEYKIGVAQGDETLASNNNIMLAPVVNVLRHPGWGRSQETYGEDPFQLGRLGAAYTVGVQEFIPACVKHYMANNLENGRETVNATMDEQTLREIYGRAFEIIVRDAGVACVMASYNLVNGAKQTENADTLTDVLRTTFGFKGFVMSDWWAMSNGQNFNAQIAQKQDAAAAGVNAGMDMELPWSMNYANIEGLVDAGRIQIATINTAVTRILEQKYRFSVGSLQGQHGLRTPTTGWDPNTTSITNNDASIELAYRAAVEGTVLLKNDGDTLPIDRATVSTVAVLGATVNYSLNQNSGSSGGVVNFATDVVTGDFGSSRMYADPAKSIGPLDGIRNAAGEGITVVTGSDVSVAQTADFIVVVAGLTPGDEGEEYTGAGDRASFRLDPKTGTNQQNDLITAAAALGKPMVVVLEGGGTIDMPWLDSVPAVMMAWYPGMVGGQAIGDLLFGDVTPSGKLPISWASWDQLPPFTLSGGALSHDYFVGYRYFDNNGTTPLFSFGHGLSYTTFEYKNLEVPCSDITPGGVAEVKVDVINRGTVAGQEVVFLFASYPNATDARRRVKKLQGFYRVALDPGEGKQVTIPLRIPELKFWDANSGSWVIEQGTVEVAVGGSAVDLPLRTTLEVVG